MSHGKDIWQRDEVSSPCINVCIIHPEARLCTGCLRSIDEIASWSGMTQDERRAVMSQLPSRGPLKATRKGGRSGRLRRQGDQD
ncbi:DUF1289 domain-containing protein [Pseudooceanicola sediminis]|uniref:DUF1289 domain-containing protein n=1 Tax=Pseudooceanicola sediminis TaxID=2211117 RepID=A0A399IYF6_9RHOB|nr:DUF1289 domain-containing protein [Pseudooceanicola sediminis]KAA2312721.1 DUF1289 domain-containing protein [Puniceibacterium sp. HSS470]RII38014.1 DUF1289 domain-containing protein [Pseudooceanicola sediminis]|tara:strand:- start:23855 stop:24106 length:252 start_codon:yes stop_codon:yes gene_type:complete